MSTRRSVLALLLLGNVMLWSCGAYAGSDSGELATPAQGSEPRQQQAARVNPRAVQHAIGGVALVRGSASVTRESKASALKVSDAIFRGDLLQTAPDGTLGLRSTTQQPFRCNRTRKSQWTILFIRNAASIM